MKGKNLGIFELHILLGCLQLQNNASGIRIWELLNQISNQSTAMGAVYATLDRLCTKRYMSLTLGKSRPVRGGRAQRFFHVTPRGMEKLKQSLEITDKLRRGLVL